MNLLMLAICCAATFMPVDKNLGTPPGAMRFAPGCCAAVTHRLSTSLGLWPRLPGWGVLTYRSCRVGSRPHRVVASMQCFVCGEPMRVVAVEPHDVIEVSGFELKTFQCVGCGDVEKRMSFDGSRTHRTVALVPDPVEPSRAPIEQARVSPARPSKVIPLP